MLAGVPEGREAQVHRDARDVAGAAKKSFQLARATSSALANHFFPSGSF
jgi:hypothetical protein